MQEKTFAYDNAFARDKLLESFSKHFFDIDILQENSFTWHFYGKSFTPNWWKIRLIAFKKLLEFWRKTMVSGTCLIWSIHFLQSMSFKETKVCLTYEKACNSCNNSFNISILYYLQGNLFSADFCNIYEDWIAILL